MALRKGLAAALAVLALAPLPSAGAAEKWPRVDGRVSVEIQNDWSYRSETPGREQNDLYATIEPEFTAILVPGLKLHVGAVLEPVRKLPAGEDRAFEDHGGYIETLYVDYGYGPVGLRLGKFTPHFGIAWDRAPGIYGSDPAESGYELSERIGVEGRVRFALEDYGSHTIRASVFFRDTSPLARSVITGRGEPSLADGGIGNTEEMNSAALSLDGMDLLGRTGLEYHVGYVNQAAGVGVEEREDGFALALVRRYRLGRGRHWFEPMIERAWFRDADGARGRDRSFLTLGGQSQWKGWNLAVTYSHVVTEDPGAAESVANQFQISMGYEFAFGLGVDVAWRSSEVEGDDSRAAGLLLSYAVEF